MTRRFFVMIWRYLPLSIASLPFCCTLGFLLIVSGCTHPVKNLPPRFIPGDRVNVSGREVIFMHSVPRTPGNDGDNDSCSDRFLALLSDGNTMVIKTDEVILVERARWGLNPDEIILEKK